VTSENRHAVIGVNKLSKWFLNPSASELTRLKHHVDSRIRTALNFKVRRHFLVIARFSKVKQ
jgi:hypothetical protein